jgi:solute carrier family 25 (adenine nucleotide translocator) protein 4/5/6/31
VQAINFACKDFFRRKIGCTNYKNDCWKWFAGNLASGGAAGAASSVLLHPLDLARLALFNNIRAAKRGEPRIFNNLTDVFKKTVATKGIAGLYNGFSLACAGVTVFRSLQFGMYDSLRPLLPGAAKDSFLASLVLGWSATFSAGFASLPIDTLRRRMNIHPQPPWHNSWHAYRDIIKKEGLQSLFKGAGILPLRSIAGAVTLSCYELLQRWFLGKNQQC